VQRLQNVKRSFALTDNASIKNKNIFLLDDVVTTGTTMQECARVLTKNGARQVIGLCVARTEN
jgi:competence protein ComFC